MATGKVVQVKGPVVDVEFPDQTIPAINNALEVVFAGEAAAEHSRVADDLVTGQGSPNGHERLVLEVQQQLGNNWVRAVAMGRPTACSAAWRCVIPAVRLPCRSARRHSAVSSTCWATRWIIRDQLTP